jgi:hypothetical protein
MAIATLGQAPKVWTVADLERRFGEIAYDRIRPGAATQQDVVWIHDLEDRGYELVDGFLVSKVLGAPEAQLPAAIIGQLVGYVRPRRLGLVLAPDGMYRFEPGLGRLPDVSFIAPERIPEPGGL